MLISKNIYIGYGLKKMKTNHKVVLITTTALFTALVTIGTTVIQIPVAGKGYTHFGDSMIYLAACILPGPCSFFAASVGAVLADLLTGYALYVPATLIIKALNAVPFVLIRIYLKRKNKDDKILNWQILLMLIPTTLVTVFGYLLADYIIVGEKAAIIAAITEGWIQPGGSAIVFVILAAALDRIKFKSKITKQI